MFDSHLPLFSMSNLYTVLIKRSKLIVSSKKIGQFNCLLSKLLQKKDHQKCVNFSCILKLFLLEKNKFCCKFNASFALTMLCDSKVKFVKILSWKL